MQQNRAIDSLARLMKAVISVTLSRLKAVRATSENASVGIGGAGQPGREGVGREGGGGGRGASHVLKPLHLPLKSQLRP